MSCSKEFVVRSYERNGLEIGGEGFLRREWLMIFVVRESLVSMRYEEGYCIWGLRNFIKGFRKWEIEVEIGGREDFDI